MAFLKTISRMFKSNFGRLIAVTAIIAIGVALMTGIGEVAPAIERGVDDYFTSRNVPDIIVKSTTAEGFTAAQEDEIARLDGVEDTLLFTAYETDVNDVLTRIYFLPLSGRSLNEIELLSGRLPQSVGEVVVEREKHGAISYEIGADIEAFGRTLKVTGITQNPLLFSKEPEPSNTEDVDLGCVIYFDSAFASEDFLFSRLPKTDMYVKLSGGMAGHDIFSEGYTQFAAAAAGEIERLPFGDSIAVLTLEENLSYVLLRTNAEKIAVISYIIPVFFVAVVALVILTTMTRLIEKERSVVGCYKTLGIDNNKIRFKYILFVLVCFILGSALGIVLGSFGIMPIIYSAYGTSLFDLPPMAGGLYMVFGLVASGIIFAAVLTVSLVVVSKQLHERPAHLLKPKAPKPGKKIFLEKIPLIWRALKFKYKSAMRNIFRNVKNFLLTVISVAGSTALVFVGFGLYDAAGANSASVAGTTGRVASSISLISTVIIICAAALSVLVMYNMTNMIIEERRREIATLKVLGYKGGELVGYIFREVVIMALIGITLGLPIGVLLAYVVFGYVDFGALIDINWYSYLLAFASSSAFVGIVALMLFRKIIRIDMNASLKSVE